MWCSVVECSVGEGTGVWRGGDGREGKGRRVWWNGVGRGGEWSGVQCGVV